MPPTLKAARSNRVRHAKKKPLPFGGGFFLPCPVRTCSHTGRLTPPRSGIPSLFFLCSKESRTVSGPSPRFSFPPARGILIDKGNARRAGYAVRSLAQGRHGGGRDGSAALCGGRAGEGRRHHRRPARPGPAGRPVEPPE